METTDTKAIASQTAQKEKQQLASLEKMGKIVMAVHAGLITNDFQLQSAIFDLETAGTFDGVNGLDPRDIPEFKPMACRTIS